VLNAPRGKIGRSSGGDISLKRNRGSGGGAEWG